MQYLLNYIITQPIKDARRVWFRLLLLLLLFIVFVAVLCVIVSLFCVSGEGFC